MRAWFRALHIRKRYLSHLLERAGLAEERVHRLEIAVRQFTERLESLEGSQDRLWAKWKGGLGGRPPKAVPAPENPLDAIPRGDKDALRAQLLPFNQPGKR